jgi:DNA polymerase-3 subunit epsilon
MSSKREIILDTETTGLDPAKGDRIVEIGCVELVGLVPTGREFHRYINPERDVPEEVVAVHGLTNAFLADKPVFLDILDELVEFIGDATLVAHNAPFDMRFLNAELQRCGYTAIDNSRVVDTVVMARRQFPGAPASLDALCRRFGVDNSNRVQHGALLDAKLLADVYLELCGGRQPDLVLGDEISTQGMDNDEMMSRVSAHVRPSRPHAPSPAELEAHQAFIAKLKDAMWLKLAASAEPS